MSGVTTRLFSLLLALSLAACGNAPNGTGGTANTTSSTTTTTSSTTPTQVGLSLSKTSIKTDGTDSTTITATVLDSGNASVQDATVSFTSTGGQLSSASAVTDGYGHASTVLTAGIARTNQTVTVTATVSGVSAQVPVQITGTTVGLTTGTTTVTSTSKDTVTVTVKDAANAPVYNVPVTFSQSGSGTVNIYAAASKTDVNGQVQADIYGKTNGSVTLKASGGGASATQTYTVSSSVTGFAITAPTSDPYSVNADTYVTVSVSVPAGVSSVRFVTSMGKWKTSGSTVQTVTVAANAASAKFWSNNSGTATVQVYDVNNTSTSASMSIVVSQPASAAKKVTLQSNTNVVAVSSGSTKNSADLTATVLDASNQAVGGAVVNFSMPAPPSGAALSKVFAVTDSLGQAKTVFTSGSVSTGAQGVNIYASVQGTTITAAKTNIVVGGTAGSIVIGRGTNITANGNAYDLPMSVLVADSNGNAVANASVTLKVFPTRFRIGGWANQDPDPTVKKYEVCNVGSSTWFDNEDTNRNLTLDTGEDVSRSLTSTVNAKGNFTCDPYSSLKNVFTAGATYAANQKLDPPNSAAGTLPATVTTDANGIANFNLTYLKGSAAWIEVEVVASTQVLGTETTSRITFTLPYIASDGTSGVLPNSTFGQ